MGNYIRFDWMIKRLLRNKSREIKNAGLRNIFLLDKEIFRNFAFCKKHFLRKIAFCKKH